MHLHKEGYPAIRISVLVLAAADGGVALLLRGRYPTGFTMILFLSLLLLLLVLNFFRVPRRPMSDGDQWLTAPADGHVVVIEETEEPEYFHDRRIQVSIFMNPLDVHVNRAPASGVVRYSQYHEGKYLVAFHPKSSTENERHSSVLATKHGEILVRQIAGFMARRIVNYLEPGYEVLQNEEIGFIKFGSRVDLFLPLETRVQVRLQQPVRGGQTILAYWV